MTLTLVSHHLCPYAQRVSISLDEKGVDFKRVIIDLSKKPSWFKRISPLGKVPLLVIENEDQKTVIFESSVILEYLEETQRSPLYSSHPLQRATERSWIEFASSLLSDIAGLYSASTDEALESKAQQISTKFATLDTVIGEGSWFSGDKFTLVDAVFGPVFRYFDSLESTTDFHLLVEYHNLQKWRHRLSNRPSIKKAVSPEYPQLLTEFLLNKKSALSRRMKTYR